MGLFKVIALLLLVAVPCAWASTQPHKVIAKSQASKAAYPEWAHHHWIWLPSPLSNQTSQIEWYESWAAHHIPVGAIDIDSLWSTGVNNFIFDPAKFPDPASMMKFFKSKGVRVILWATSVVNDDSSNWWAGFNNNYFMNNGTMFKWWHGWGSFVDYTNPAAVDWWHKQMDLVLDIGIDGWKTDGTDPYIIEFINPVGYSGPVGYHEYSQMYYRDFLYYSRTKNPDALIMSRPVDSLVVGNTYNLFYSYSPHDVMISGWVGDQQGTWAGLQHAINNMIESALRNYANYGSDIGGYKKTPNRELIVFVRWFQLGAFVPLMENGGDDEHRPWKYDAPGSTLIVDTYRKFVNTHLELLPYFLNAGTIALATNTSVMKPRATQVALPPHSYDYWLWTNIFVAPIADAPGTYKNVRFPGGANYLNYWDSSKYYPGGSTLNMTFGITDFPAYQRTGSLIPLEVVSADTNHGIASDSPLLTAMIAPEHTQAPVTEVVRRWTEEPMEMSYYWPKGGKLHFQSTAHSRGVVVLLRGVSSCHDLQVADEIYSRKFVSRQSLIELYQVAAHEPGYFCDAGRHQLFIHLGNTSPHGSSISVSEFAVSYLEY